MVTLAALVAFIPLSSIAEDGNCHLGKTLSDDWCTLNEVELAETYVIEGTRKGDRIDCRNFHDNDGDRGVSIYGNGGDDVICGSDYNDFIAGGGGNDTILGGLGNDAIDGGAKDDDLWGGPGDDIIFGGVGASPASGVDCDLKTPPSAATGRIYLAKGGSGDDSIYGGDGDDCINAGSGEDILMGGEGNDTLIGGNHADILDGGPGDDYMDGGWHTDKCVDDVEDTYNTVDCEIIL